MIFAIARLVTSGIPQSVAASTAPAMPIMTIRGVTYPTGSATQRVRSLSVQAYPSNGGDFIFLGGRTMDIGSGNGVGMVLAKGAPPLVLGDGEGFALDDLYFDSSVSGDRLMISIIG